MSSITPSGNVLHSAQFSYIESLDARVENIVTTTLTTTHLIVPGCEYEVPSVYPTIQEAVDAAQLTGTPQTVHICSGTYPGNVTITGPISLRGEGYGSLIFGKVSVTGDISAIDFTSSIGVTISGLTIANGGNNDVLSIDQIGSPNSTRYVVSDCFLFSPQTNIGRALFCNTGSAVYIQNCNFIAEDESAIYFGPLSQFSMTSNCSMGHGPGTRTVEVLHYEGQGGQAHNLLSCFVSGTIHNTLPGPIYHNHIVVDGCHVNIQACYFQLGDDNIIVNEEVANGIYVSNNGILSISSSVMNLRRNVPFANHFLFDGDGTGTFIDGKTSTYLSAALANDRLRNAGFASIINGTTVPTIV